MKTEKCKIQEPGAFPQDYSKWAELLDEAMALPIGEALLITPDCKVSSAKSQLYRMAQIKNMQMRISARGATVKIWRKDQRLVREDT